jgi:hypothetical protein
VQVKKGERRPKLEESGRMVIYGLAMLLLGVTIVMVPVLASVAISPSHELDGLDIIVPDSSSFCLPPPFFTCTIHGSIGRSGINTIISHLLRDSNSFVKVLY